MATRKTRGTLAPAGRPDISAGGGPRPTLASGPLLVAAQGATLKDDDRLFVVVRVTDAEGVPLAGLKKANFKLWQMGHLFGDLTIKTVVDTGTIAGLEGCYHVVCKPWSLVGNGTIPFLVRVEKGKLRHGTALTFIVKVRDGLDL